jgi:hypothetical protein
MSENETPPPQQPSIGMTSGERLSVRSTTMPDRSLSQPSGFRACPYCAGPVHFTQCVWCGSRFHRTCSKCGDIGCGSRECGLVFRTRLTNAVIAGLGVAVLIWFGIRSHIPNPWEPPAHTLRRQLAANGAWRAGISYDAYVGRASKPNQVVTDDRYGPILATLLANLGPSSSNPVTVRNSGLVAEDLLTLVYGALLPETVVNLLALVKVSSPVEPDAVPRQGDIIICEQKSTIYWAIMIGGGGKTLFYSTSYERFVIGQITDEFWRKGLIAVLRPRDH